MSEKDKMLRQMLYDANGDAVLLSLIHISEPTRHSLISYAVFCLKKFFLMIRRPPRSTHCISSAASDVYKRQEYKERYEALGIEYFYTLIDDAVARVIRSNGGYIWACKNYDGDVMSDMVSTAYGSLAMMTSVLVSPDGIYEYEAAHGTVQRHYYKYLKGEETSTNSVATIFAWSGALRKRGELDKTPDLVEFADKLEKATIQTIENA